MPSIKPMKTISLAPVFGGIKRLGKPTRRINENDFFAPVHDDLSDLPIFSSAPKPKDTQLHAATRLKETFDEEIQSLAKEDTELYGLLYDYVTGIAFDKYYEKDVVKGQILASFSQDYIDQIFTAFNNART